jgi:hypothetical protein
VHDIRMRSLYLINIALPARLVFDPRKNRWPTTAPRTAVISDQLSLMFDHLVCATEQRRRNVRPSSRAPPISVPGGALFAVSLCYSVSSTHRSISDATIRRLGRCGFMVPAMTFNPSDNIALANCLASISVGNDLDRLGEGVRDDLGRHWLGLSIETYQ